MFVALQLTKETIRWYVSMLDGTWFLSKDLRKDVYTDCTDLAIIIHVLFAAVATCGQPQQFGTARI